VLPALAFAALALPLSGNRVDTLDRRATDLRLAAIAAGVALFIVLFSVGTGFPGSVVFDPLYGLPLGWLLREPIRFQMIAALMYGVLVAILVRALVESRSRPALTRLSLLATSAWRFSIVPVALLACTLVGFPLFSGALVPNDGATHP